jgi:hypothetical protein
MMAALCGTTVIWLGVAAIAQAHGMVAEVQASTGAVVVACAYSNGDPVDAEVLVYSPTEAGRIFQKLRTDIRGFASFVPDAAGTWTVVADDGIGHRAELELAVEDGAVAASVDRAPSLSGAFLSLVMAALALAVWRTRRKHRAERPEARQL